MTYEGLVEKNLATGEQERITQRGQDFDLRQEQPELARELEKPQAMKKQSRNAAQVNPNSREDSQPPVRSVAPNEEIPAPSPKAKQHGTKYHQQFVQEAVEPDTPQKQSRLQFDVKETPPSFQPPADKKLTSAQNRAEAVNERLQQAREQLPTKKKLKVQRVYDEQKSKTKRKLYFEETPLTRGEKIFKPPAVVAKPLSAVKGGTGMAARGVHAQFHRKMYQVENENVGLKAAHQAEIATEGGLRTGKRAAGKAFRFVRDKPYRTVEKLEKQAVKANVKLSYRKALAENPQLKSNVMSRFLQKRKIKKAYAKSYRNAKRTGQAAKKTGSAIGKAASAVVGVIRRHPAVAGIIAVILLLVFFIMSAFSSCSGMASGMLSSVVGTSYLAEDTEIELAELSYTEWETDLLIQMQNAETSHPGYNEYRYSAGDVGHNPFELMGFLTAVYQDFQYAAIEPVLLQIFQQQYQLTFIEEIEVRYADPEDLDEDGDTEPYDWYILHVNLASQSFSGLVTPLMDTGQTELYGVYMQTKGNRQYLENPFAFNWLPYVSDLYGWRIHPINGGKDYHKGIDIAVASGTEILAGHDGVVSQAGDVGSFGLLVVIEGENGLVSKYAHCSELLISSGQTVQQGDVIAKVGSTGGSTGAHLHLEVLKNGQHLNPIYFAQTGDDGTGSLPPGSPGGPEFGNPGSAMGDGSYAALIAEAELHLGKRYVFGANGPANFDCSSYVCWVLDKSGVRPMGRTTAQGLYNMSNPVSAANAQPGDLIFFHSTYSTSNTVTHVGIYVGGGMMIHCGDPVQYVSISTSYWQQHFYAFGRI